ncbi:hypothetical protein Tco_0068882, partial [Tanacetum coccineum]
MAQKLSDQKRIYKIKLEGRCQVKFATCTLQGNALTWWNSHIKTTTHEATHAIPWGDTEEDNDRQILQRFQELALMCDQMFLKEIDRVEKYVGGLPDMIHGSVMATRSMAVYVCRYVCRYV